MGAHAVIRATSRLCSDCGTGTHTTNNSVCCARAAPPKGARVVMHAHGIWASFTQQPEGLVSGITPHHINPLVCGFRYDEAHTYRINELAALVFTTPIMAMRASGTGRRDTMACMPVVAQLAQTGDVREHRSTLMCVCMQCETHMKRFSPTPSPSDEAGAQPSGEYRCRRHTNV